MKVKIKKWNAVATWRWDIPEDDVCGICQVHFDGTCPTCKYPGDDCPLLSGKCGHNFHMDCLKSELALSIDNSVEIQGYTAWLEDAPGNQLTLRHVL
ncbi:hypothetical protein NEMBOFW57_010441 [Staphylotrichum longicolle]|uniref:Anaphase-promoting complex subunit 11 RING-H2 finger domain-containing protein n=1 Tax=Staphylotrichum longicolle TaxID=669026 RepID=A0AAD4EN41_9PEZI|nr:hypothetical protein NEMBOFW57_010441 [Staphylotrichum longicolle]